MCLAFKQGLDVVTPLYVLLIHVIHFVKILRYKEEIPFNVFVVVKASEGARNWCLVYRFNSFFILLEVVLYLMRQ